jgi:hypothetical protein
MPVIQPPDGLEATGKQLWDSVVEVYALTPSETATLGEACRTADELDRLERAVRALPDLMVTGSMGQLKPHPLLGEVRAPTATRTPLRQPGAAEHRSAGRLHGRTTACQASRRGEMEQGR